MREYGVPEGVLSAEELQLLRDGGIRDSDSDALEEEGHARTRARGGRTLEIETLRSVHQNQLSMKDKQIQFLQAELGRREHLLELERQKVRAEMQVELERLAGELRNARARVIQTEGQIPLIKEALAQVRDMLGGLVPESVYLRLRDVPERDLPPAEWLLVSVWEMCAPFRKEATTRQQEVSRLREELKAANDKQHGLLGELEHYSRLLASKDDDEKRHLLNFENSRKGLEL
jgi:progesterone-induced-blocking factor 1